MKNKSDKSRIFKNTIIVTSASILEKLIFFIISVIIARFLKIEQYGEYTTALEFATFFSVFTNIGINQTLIRAINIEPQYEREHFTNNLIIKTFLAITVYLLLVISLFFTNYNTNTIYLTLIFGFVRIGNEFLVSFYALNDAKEHFNIQAIFTSLFSLSFLGSTIIIILLKGNYFHFAITRSILVIFFLTIILIYTFKFIKLKYNSQTLKKFLKETIPFTLSIFYSNIIQRTNIIILSLMHGPIYSGIFNNGYLFYLSLQFIPLNLQRVLIPFLYKIPYKDNKDKFQFTFDIFSKYLSIISIYIMIIMFFFSRDIILTIFSDKYKDSIEVLRIISFGIPFFFLWFTSISIITSLDKQRIVSYIMGIAVIINIIANLILIYFYKTKGAAFSTIITTFSIFLLSNLYLSMKKFIKIKPVIIIYGKLALTSIFIFLIHHYFLTDLSVIFSFIIINMVYLIIIFLLIINRHDIRILKEIIGLKKD